MSDYERVPILHLHGQFSWHGEATIVGNRAAFTALRDALDDMLASKETAEVEMFAADGEGYHLNLILRDGTLDDPRWEGCRLPYTAEFASGRGGEKP